MVLPRETRLAAGARRELLENILPFWRRHAVDHAHGGFVAELANDLRPAPAAGKGLVLNARILWTFAAASHYTGNATDRELARRALDYLVTHFRDPEHGGLFWELAPEGSVRDDGKKIYGQAFGIYALAEYDRVFGDPAARGLAIELFRLIERHSRDPVAGGYLESFTRDWQPAADMRLSDQDANEKKSMNNHLHVLEAYTNLYRVWADPVLAARLRELIGVFQHHIAFPDGSHFHHFFDEAWRPKSDSYTFGPDLEGSWLLCEAAEVLGDPALLAEVRTLAARLARAVLHEGVDTDGGLLYEGRGGCIINDAKEWWPQAEAVVGFYNAWQLTRDEAFLDAAARCWQFIQDFLVDRVHGEWFWRVARDATPDLTPPKVSMWKCPYHNGRCCLEVIRRVAAESQPPNQP